jgi:hypothetical protein
MSERVPEEAILQGLIYMRKVLAEHFGVDVAAGRA